MKAILIDSANRIFREVDIDETPESICAHLTTSTEKVDLFQMLPIAEELFAYVDEDSLLRRPLPGHWFWHRDYAHPLAGNAVVVGPSDGFGNSRPPAVTVPELAARVQFLSLLQVVERSGQH